MRYSTAALLLTLAGLGCGLDVTIGDPKSKCSVTDRGKWRDSGLGESEVLDPRCPVVVTFNDYPTLYSVDVVANDFSKLSPSPIVLLSFFDNNSDPIPPDVVHKDLIFGFNGNVAQLIGSYYAAHASGVSEGNDFGRPRLPLSTFVGGYRDTARAEVFLRYKFHSQATVAGPDVGSTTEAVIVSADADGEFRPITYEWWIDGTHQGPPSDVFSINHVFETAGAHSVRVVVRANDGHVYDLTKYIEITPCPNGEIIC